MSTTSDYTSPPAIHDHAGRLRQLEEAIQSILGMLDTQSDAIIRLAEAVKLLNTP